MIYRYGRRSYSMSGDETVSHSPGEMGGKNSTLPVNGNGHNITAKDDKVSGVIVNGGQTLEINRVGDVNNNDSKGF